LDVCVPQKLTHSWNLLGALKSRGWNFEVVSPRAKWGTLRKFVTDHPEGVWAVETKTHVTLIRDGVVYDYANRGADGRRVKMVYRLWQR
jgi:hypothetical protein